MFSLQQKVAIVTGAGSGIGAAIADCFAEAGALVHVADCNETNGVETVRKIEQRGGKAKLAVVDIVNESECQALVRQVLTENAGRCDVLVNNAGVGHVGTILTTEPADLERLWQINLRGAYFLSRAVLPAMIERRAGSIINLASFAGITGMVPHAGRLAYTVSKPANVGLTRAGNGPWPDRRADQLPLPRPDADAVAGRVPARLRRAAGIFETDGHAAPVLSTLRRASEDGRSSHCEAGLERWATAEGGRAPATRAAVRDRGGGALHRERRIRPARGSSAMVVDGGYTAGK